MADFAHSTPTFEIHTLTGSTPPGAGRPVLMPAGSRPAPNPQTQPRNGGSVVNRLAVQHGPDAELIDFAGRVVRLAERDQLAWDRRAAIEDEADGKLPPSPEPETLPEPVVNEAWRADGSTGPMFDPPDYGARALALDARHRAAVANRERSRTKIEARLGLPRWEKLSLRTFRRLKRWTARLTAMEPVTQAGLKAKAEAQLAICGINGFDDWTQTLATSVGRDAVRIATAVADLPVPRMPFVSGIDPIIALHRRAEALFAYGELEDTSNDDAMRALGEANALVENAVHRRPVTPAGAIAALEWGLAELRRMQEQRSARTPWDLFTNAMIEGSLAIFRDLVARQAEDAADAVSPAPAAGLASTLPLDGAVPCTPAQAAVLEFTPWPDPCPLPGNEKMFRILTPHLELIRMGWATNNKSKADLITGIEKMIRDGDVAAIGELMNRLNDTTALLDELRSATNTAHLRLLVASSVLSLNPRYADVDLGPILSETTGAHAHAQAAA